MRAKVMMICGEVEHCYIKGNIILCFAFPFGDALKEF